MEKVLHDGTGLGGADHSSRGTAFFSSTGEFSEEPGPLIRTFSSIIPFQQGGGHCRATALLLDFT
jgi:hypothetical protein